MEHSSLALLGLLLLLGLSGLSSSAQAGASGDERCGRGAPAGACAAESDHLLLQFRAASGRSVLNLDAGGDELLSGDAVFLRSADGTRLTAEGDGHMTAWKEAGGVAGDMHAAWKHQGKWQMFVMEKADGGAISAGDEVFLKAFTGKYVTAAGQLLHCISADQGQEQTFVLRTEEEEGPIADGNQVRLETSTGEYIDFAADQGGVQAGALGSSSQWTVEKISEERRKVLEAMTEGTTAAPTSGKMGAGSTEGLMTMWSDSDTTIVGGSCEYANAANGGVGSPAATSPYVGRRFYCAADDALYAGGANCGACYRVTYDGSEATDDGRPGDAIVQIVDSGSAKTFDCQVDPFETITGARTGVFPISYEPVDCDTADGGAVVTVLDGSNAWYTKVIFSNLPGAVLGAEIIVGGTTYVMERAGGAVWKSQLSGLTGPAEFRATTQGGVVEFGGCFGGSWPVETSSECGAMAAPSPTPAPATTTLASTTPATTTQPAATTPAATTAAPTTTTAQTTPIPTTTPPSATTVPPSGCQKVWQQCGGMSWKGATCCAEGSECVASSKYYSQCKPASDGSTTIAPTPSTTGATTTQPAATTTTMAGSTTGATTTQPAATTPAATTTAGSTTATTSTAPSDEWVTGTWTTGYWDCCKPSCSWAGKGNVNKPIQACHVETGGIADASEASVCDGGKAASCPNNEPLEYNSTLSFGFAAAAVSGSHGLTGDENCGQCFELVFIDQGHPNSPWDPWGGAASDLVGKRMVIQVTNIGYDVSGEHSFDLQIPGAGQGAFSNGCSAQFPGYDSGDFDCDNLYGGCHDIGGCARLPKALQPGCEWRHTWYRWLTQSGKTNNPYVNYRRVQCPTKLTDISGSKPLDDASYPAVSLVERLES